MLASRLYMREGSHAEYYRASLHFLGCTELNTLGKDERIEQAFNLSLAALLGKDIFNFGELLAHPILDDLKDTQKVGRVKGNDPRTPLQFCNINLQFCKKFCMLFFH